MATEKRITVGLSAAAVEALEATTARTGLSITEVVNRALTVHDFIDAKTRNGHQLELLNTDTKERTWLHLL